MTFVIRLEGVEHVEKVFATLEPNVQRIIVKRMQTEAKGATRKARARSTSFHYAARFAGSTVRYGRAAGGGDIKAGGTGGLPQILLFGAEFGGRRKRHTYASRSKTGRPYIVWQRRTTMQFLPHLGRHGFFFWPGIREQLGGVLNRTRDAVARGINGVS
jgi:hypothetical protein